MHATRKARTGGDGMWRATRVLLGAALALCLFTPGVYAQEEEGDDLDDTGTPEAAVPAAAHSTRGVDAAQEALGRLDEITFFLDKRRGLAPREPFRTAVETRQGLRTRLEALIAEEYSPREIDAQQRLLRTLGVLRADQDWLAMTLALLEEQIAGFYDDQTKTLYLMADGDPASQVPVAVHELVHALQDQHYGIGRVRGRTERITDVSLARTALIEGDAVVVMLDWLMGGTVEVQDVPMLANLLQQSMPASSDATSVEVPDAIWQQLIYPYVGGASFVIALLRDKGWAAVDAAYASPPDSTEQVLRPELYLRRDDPTWLEYTPDPHSGCATYIQDVVGEYMLRAILDQLLSSAGLVTAAAVQRATRGWDGDRLQACSYADDPGRDRLRWASVWDSEEEAVQFYRVAVRLAEAWTGRGALPVGSGAHGEAVESAGPDAFLRIERWGDQVLLVMDRGGNVTDERRRWAVEWDVEAIWTSLTRHQYPDFSLRD